MSRPQSEAEYLARLVPPSVAGAARRRRTVLKGALGAGAALGAAGPARRLRRQQQWSGAGTAGAQLGAPTGTVTVGSNYSDAIPKGAMQAVADALQGELRHDRQDQHASTTTRSRRTSTTTSRASRTTCSPGSPATGCASSPPRAWPATSATCGASSPASPTRSRRRRPATTASSTSCRSYNYPWAVFYRPSVWTKYGYTVPKTLDELKTLGTQMQKDGLVPIAFGDKDGWPAMGTLRHPQHADQRVPVPHRPDGAQESPGTPPRSRRSSTPGPGCCRCHQTDLARPHLAGGRAVPPAEEGRHVPARLCSWPSRSTTATTSTSSPSRRSTRRSAPTRSTPRSTAS